MKENALNKQQIDSYTDHLVREEYSPETIKNIFGMYRLF